MVTVLGAGSWGTALALHVARTRQDVSLWAHRPEHAKALADERVNRRYLPEAPFPDNLSVHDDLGDALSTASLVIVAVPSQAYRSTLLAARASMAAHCPVAWATKGLEHGSGRFLHEVTNEILGSDHPQAIISGPSFAREVAAGLPTAITVASTDGDFATLLARRLHGDGLRAYSSSDVVGVEVGGAVKNVLAIAAGISDGLGYGANTRSALITRGLAEVVRLGVAVGGERETFMGLAGLGDLILTCTDDQSRNRRFGLAIGSGANLEQARDDIGQVVEGVATAREIMRLSRAHDVDMPICAQVSHVVHDGLPPRQAVDALLAREPRAESG